MSSMPVFENPCGAYSRYEITKDIPLDRLETICAAEKDGTLFIGGIDSANGKDFTAFPRAEAEKALGKEQGRDE